MVIAKIITMSLVVLLVVQLYCNIVSECNRIGSMVSVIENMAIAMQVYTIYV